MAFEVETISILLGIAGILSWQIQRMEKRNEKDHKILWSAVVKIANKIGISLNEELVK